MTTDPIIVFDAAFLRDDVLSQLDRFGISLPAYISSEELRPLSKFLAGRGRATKQPLVLRTDKTNAVVSISQIRDPSSPPLPEPDSRNPPDTKTSYARIFQNLDLDVYDVDSHDGLYYVTDRTRNAIVVINDRSEIQRVISGIGSSPGRLFHPGYISVAADGIMYVQDGGNERIESFRPDGTYLSSFATEQYAGFAAGSGGEVYLGQPEKGALVSVYSREGKELRSFGKLKAYSDIFGAAYKNSNQQYANAINRVRLSTDNEGNILVSFMLVPILQKYDREGKLIFESRIEGPEIDELRASTGHLTISTDGFAEEIIALEAISLPNGEIEVVLTDGSIYVADHEGRRLRVLHPRSDTQFTPEMTGITPAGDLLLISLSPRNCYQAPAS